MKIPEHLHKSFVMAFLKPLVFDGVLGEADAERLYQVYASIEMQPSERQAILREAVEHPNAVGRRTIPEELMRNKRIRMALGKEAVAQLEDQTDPTVKQELRKLLAGLAINQKQIAFLKDWVRWENRILKKIGAEDFELADEDSPKELLARAAGLGIPLVSLYFAGIVGFSAVGISSGLAALGGISGLTLLGLNPMTAGIAALIMIGISVKKIIDIALKNSGKEGEKRRIKKEVDRLKALRTRVGNYAAEDLQGIANDRSRLATRDIRTEETLEGLLKHVLSAHTSTANMETPRS